MTKLNEEKKQVKDALKRAGLGAAIVDNLNGPDLLKLQVQLLILKELRLLNERKEVKS